MMKKSEWNTPLANDEYATKGDTACVDVKGYAYYWNELRSVVRRYGANGSYCEVNCWSRPLAGKLGEVFAKAKHTGRLRAVELGQPEPAAA